MALRTKKTLRKSLFLLTAASSLALSTTVGYCADERLDAARSGPSRLGDLCTTPHELFLPDAADPLRSHAHPNEGLDGTINPEEPEQWQLDYLAESELNVDDFLTIYRVLKDPAVTYGSLAELPRAKVSILENLAVLSFIGYDSYEKSYPYIAFREIYEGSRHLRPSPKIKVRNHDAKLVKAIVPLCRAIYSKLCDHMREHKDLFGVPHPRWDEFDRM